MEWKGGGRALNSSSAIPLAIAGVVTCHRGEMEGVSEWNGRGGDCGRCILPQRCSLLMFSPFCQSLGFPPFPPLHFSRKETL